MNGNKLLLDTNILIYLLAGDDTLIGLLEKKQIYVSFITELELLGFRNSDQEKEKILNMLSFITILDINKEIKSITVQFRKDYRLKLPDSIIAATAFYLNIPLVTADDDFSKISELNMLKYEK